MNRVFQPKRDRRRQSMAATLCPRPGSKEWQKIMARARPCSVRARERGDEPVVKVRELDPDRAATLDSDGCHRIASGELGPIRTEAPVASQCVVVAPVGSQESSRVARSRCQVLTSECRTG